MRLKIIDIFRVLLLYDLTLHYVTAYLRWSSRMTSLSHGGTKPKGVFGFLPFHLSHLRPIKKNQETGLKGWVAWIGLSSVLKDGLNFSLESVGCLLVWVWVFSGSKFGVEFGFFQRVPQFQLEEVVGVMAEKREEAWSEKREEAPLCRIRKKERITN